MEDACDLESLRLKEDANFICNSNCSNISADSITECSTEITRHVFRDPLNSEEDEDKCCGLTEEELKIVLGSILGFVGAVIVGIVIWRCVVWEREKKK